MKYAYSGKFRVKTELEQQIWDECARLICNCIIFLNTWILSSLHTELSNEGREKEKKIIERVSPVAWRHVNLRGNFNFENQKEIEFDEILIDLVKMTDADYDIDKEDFFK